MPEIPCTGTEAAPRACLDQGTLEAAVQHIKNEHQGHKFNVPWWGQSNSAHIKNAGYVIGFKSDQNDKITWRLDYDPVKGLHINYSDSTAAETRKVWHKITALTKYPAWPLPLPALSAEENQHALWLFWTRNLHVANPPDETQKAQIVAKMGYTWDVHKAVLADKGHEWKLW